MLLISDQWFQRFDILLHNARDLNTNNSNPNTKGKNIYPHNIN